MVQARYWMPWARRMMQHAKAARFMHCNPAAITAVRPMRMPSSVRTSTPTARLLFLPSAASLLAKRCESAPFHPWRCVAHY